MELHVYIEGPTPSVVSTIEDLNPNRVIVRCDAQLPFGARVTLRFAEAGGRKGFDLSGRVSWSRSNDTTGITFDSLNALTVHRLSDVQRALAQVNKAALRDRWGAHPAAGERALQERRSAPRTSELRALRPNPAPGNAAADDHSLVALARRVTRTS